MSNDLTFSEMTWENITIRRMQSDDGRQTLHMTFPFSGDKSKALVEALTHYTQAHPEYGVALDYLGLISGDHFFNYPEKAWPPELQNGAPESAITVAIHLLEVVAAAQQSEYYQHARDDMWRQA